MHPKGVRLREDPGIGISNTCAIAPQAIARFRGYLNGVTSADLPRQLPSGHHHHKHDAVTVLQGRVKLIASYPYLSIEQHLDYWIQLALFVV